MSTHATPLNVAIASFSIVDLPFVKMHGTGNDFVVLDALSQSFPDDFNFARAAQTMCERHRGIGGDGLLLLEAPTSQAARNGASARMRMWNPDGSEDMCGNGLRCIVRLAHARGHVSQDDFTVETLAGLRRVEVLSNDSIRVAMGKPMFALDQIPMRPPAEWPNLNRAIEYSLSVAGENIGHVSTLSTGTAHTIIFIEKPLDDETFLRLSPQIEHHAWFPERTSIMWAQVLNRESLRLRIWERGAGETLACGTGACAAAVAAQVTGRCGEDVTVQSRGGALKIHWKNGGDIAMTGPAKIVYEGRLSF